MNRSSPRRLSILDASFLSMETRDTPMHVGALMTFKLPADAPKGYVNKLVQRYRTPSELARPWNLKLAAVPLARLMPAMEPTEDVDLHYHVRHSALPSPGGERELGELISHLHSQLLDRSRPLWTCHVIEGLHAGRFAIYLKIHHALTDGIKGMRLICDSLADAPTKDFAPPWESRETAPRSAGGREASPEEAQAAPTPAQWPRLALQAIRPLFRREAGEEAVHRPFEAPNSSLLNGRVTGARRIATQQLPLTRLKRIAKQHEVSLNDVFLAVCSGALRRHLQENGALPDASLIAAVPASLRMPGDTDSGNAVGFLWAALGTQIADPAARLVSIHASMKAWKHHLRSLPPQVRLAFTSLVFVPAVAVLTSGLGARVRPPMNIVISNVPGPERPLYLGLAKMQAMYPVSIPIQGQALNISCVSYAGKLNLGFTGSRDRLPHLQRIAVYAGEALAELEQATRQAA